jgi:hypothetical protein
MAYTYLNHKPCGYKYVIDHINSVKNDNRLENLRIITHRQNCLKDRTGKSKYIGVSWDKASEKWRSRIQINGKSKNLGSYNCELKAHYVYMQELKKIQ